MSKCTSHGDVGDHVILKFNSVNPNSGLFIDLNEDPITQLHTSASLTARKMDTLSKPICGILMLKMVGIQSSIFQIMKTKIVLCIINLAVTSFVRNLEFVTA
jgi:hypothetical protein